MCLLSGDPSPVNWGLRADSSLVMFDWERVGFGHPAIDLACFAFGQESRDVFEKIAHGYLKYRPELNWEANLFATEIQVVRAYLVLVMLSNQTLGIGEMPEHVLNYFKADFPVWLETLKC